MKYKVAVAGLRMGDAWARSAVENPDTELVACYDKYFDENQIQKAQSNPAGMQIIENLKSSLFELLNQV